jgi:hypothetical protein
MPMEVGAKGAGEVKAGAEQPQYALLLSELSDFDKATSWGSTTMWATAFLDAWGHDLGLGKGALALKKQEVSIDGVDYRVVDIFRALRDGESMKGAPIRAGQFVAIVVEKPATRLVEVAGP